MPFFCIHISQGNVATCLKRGGIFKQEFVANLLQSPLVKKFRVIIGKVMAKSLVSCFFDSRCRYLSILCQWSYYTTIMSYITSVRVTVISEVLLNTATVHSCSSSQCKQCKKWTTGFLGLQGAKYFRK